MNFIHCFRSEWLKKKNSAASWLMLIGGFFIPLIILIARMTDIDMLYRENTSLHVWEIISNRCWQFMAVFLLPMGVILAGSLITQLEFKNNTWKQVHATPQSLSVLFFAKLSVIVVMMLQFFVLFNIGIYLAGVVPSFLFRGIPYPQESIPFVAMLKLNMEFFIDCLPVIALQYLISLQFRNFLVPVGVGLALLVASMIAVSWKYAYIVPYAYCMLDFMNNRNNPSVPGTPVHTWAFAYFMVFTGLSYILYIRKKEKG
ncbi:MAG: transporter protein [Bacteroidetes bacterium]|nr:transporter protein [Bacteroidota bacterium]